MIVKLLTEHNLEFLGLTGGCTGSSESTLAKMPHCWKSHAEAHIMSLLHYVISYGHLTFYNLNSGYLKYLFKSKFTLNKYL